MGPRRGFTTADLAVVLVIIFILSSIVISAGLTASRNAREADYVAAVEKFHTAIGLFATDCGGFPERLTDLLSPIPPTHCRSIVDGSRKPIDPTKFRGPYLAPDDGQMPRDPLTGSRRWRYMPAQGIVQSPAVAEPVADVLDADL